MLRKPYFAGVSLTRRALRPQRCVLFSAAARARPAPRKPARRFVSRPGIGAGGRTWTGTALSRL